MNPIDPLLFRQLSMVQKIIADETWLESERRGYAVAATDSVVRENVCRVVLRVGREMREAAARALEAGMAPQEPSRPEAA